MQLASFLALVIITIAIVVGERQETNFDNVYSMYISRSQFALLSAVLFLLFENVASILPLYSSVLLTSLRDWQHNEGQLRQTIFNQSKAIAHYNPNETRYSLNLQLTVGKSQE